MCHRKPWDRCFLLAPESTWTMYKASRWWWGLGLGSGASCPPRGGVVTQTDSEQPRPQNKDSLVGTLKSLVSCQHGFIMTKSLW